MIKYRRSSYHQLLYHVLLTWFQKQNEKENERFDGEKLAHVSYWVSALIPSSLVWMLKALAVSAKVETTAHPLQMYPGAMLMT